jgi:hypothetical protein
MFAARKEYISTKADVLHRLLAGLKEAIEIFYSTPDMSNQIAKVYGLKEDDAQEYAPLQHTF